MEVTADDIKEAFQAEKILELKSEKMKIWKRI